MRGYINLLLTLTLTLTIAINCSERQVYLLTPMDRATLPHAKSTILHYTLSIPGNEGWSIANCYTDRQMSLSSTLCTIMLKLHLVD